MSGCFGQGLKLENGVPIRTAFCLTGTFDLLGYLFVFTKILWRENFAGVLECPEK